MGIKLVGVELEGGWVGISKPAGYRTDGSVQNLPGYYDWRGEVASKPLPKHLIGAWIMEVYPNTSNSTCGCHVHMSFESKLEYSQLMTHGEALEAELLSRLESWGRELVPRSGDGLSQSARIHDSSPFWDRISGNNSMCMLGGDPDSQASVDYKSGARYRVLNFCHKLHGTLECRVLPMFKQPALTVAAVQIVMDTVESVLSGLSKERKHIRIETNLGPIICKAWRQGHTASLLASPAIKNEAKTLLFGRYIRIQPSEQSSELVSKLLTQEHVQVPMATHERMLEMLTNVKYWFDRLTVSLTKREEM